LGAVPVPLSVLARKMFVSPKPGSDPTVPGLVWEAPPSETSDGGHWALTHAGHELKRPRAGEPIIFFVEKSRGSANPFAMGITIGRVDNNDIVVDDGSVSRFHCWLQLDERTHQWSLTDAESKNGTWVDGVKAEARQRIVLKDGTKLKCGDVVMTFFTPAALKAFVGQRYHQAT
jgi:hypothetical protein